MKIPQNDFPLAAQLTGGSMEAQLLMDSCCSEVVDNPKNSWGEIGSGEPEETKPEKWGLSDIF